jgi:hypothetical protein
MVKSAIFIPSNLGIEKNEEEKIEEMKSKACQTFLARKKIHIKMVRVKVIPIENASLKDGNHFPFATISLFFNWLLLIIEGKMKMAFNSPQTTYVQLDPCQNPLRIKIIKVFLIFCQVDPILPPSGIYT